MGDPGSEGRAEETAEEDRSDFHARDVRGEARDQPKSCSSSQVCENIIMVKITQRM